MKKLIACFAFVAILFCNMTIISADELSGMNDLNGNLKVPEPVGTKVIYYDVPISKELQKFMWEECYRNSISYEMVLAIIKVESRFDPNAKSITNDYSLMQVNGETFKWINKKFNNQLNIYNEKDNIKAGIWYLCYLRDYWRELGLCEEEVFLRTCMSYHRGIQGSIDYSKINGLKSEYINEIIKYKELLERS